MEVKYSILDPTGNITALVESEVESPRRAETAAAIMRLHPEVEQVGFLSPAGADALPSLRMAGGEFCGNATMCAAALLALRGAQGDPICLRVSGAAEPLAVNLRRMGGDAFLAELRMPPALELSTRNFEYEGLRGPLPLVRMQGISHLVAEEASPFFSLLREREAAQSAVRRFCAALAAEGLGLMFLEGEGSERRMTPLVYIPGSGTLFWENACASGSAAVGMYLAARSGAPVELKLHEPGGVLSVSSDPRTGVTRLRGGVRLAAVSTLEI